MSGKHRKSDKKADRPFPKNTKVGKLISIYPLPQKKKPGFYRICRLQRSIIAKNPVSKILINDCARGHHDYAHDRRENAHDPHDYAHDPHENARDPEPPNSD